MSNMLFMAEDSAPQTGVPDEGGTVILPDASRTELAELAWSIDQPGVDDPGDHPGASWRRVAVIGAVIVAAAAMVAGGIIAWNRYGQTPPAAVPSTAANSAPVVAPAPPAALPTVQAVTPDQQYLNNLAAGGISIAQQHDADAIGLGHVICDSLAQGFSKDEAAQSIQRHAPQLSAAQDQFIVDQAAATYCPWYR